MPKKLVTSKKLIGVIAILNGLFTSMINTSAFIKQYNQKRFDEEKLSHVKTALAIQDMAHRHGVCCPKVHQFDGQHLTTSHQGQTFTVLETMEGNVLPSGKASSTQMFSLGQALGKLHQVLSCISPADLFWIPNKDRLTKKWKNQMTLAQEEKPSEWVLLMLHKQKQILDTLDFSIFNENRKGWVHWDFYFDNFLFMDDELTAILDFDRMRYAYPDLDVARGALSGCFSIEQGMDLDKVTAFLNGYQEYFPDYNQGDFVRALRLLWAEESSRWITANIEARDSNPQRFAKEINWLQENWDQLEDILLKEV